MEIHNKNLYATNNKNRFLWYLSEIERNKIWPLSWVITYKEQAIDSLENYITKQLFNETNQSIQLEDIESSIGFISWWYNNLKKIKKEIQNEQALSPEQKNYIINSIKEIQTRQLLILNWIYIEAEKWWYQLSKQKRNILKNRIQIISQQIRWPRISDSPGEKQLILNEIKNKYTKNNNKINDKEKELINNFLESRNKKPLNKKEKFYKDTKKEKIENNEKGLELKDYANVIKMILEEIYGIKPVIIISHNIDYKTWENIDKNFFDTENNTVYFNKNTDSYDKDLFLNKNNIKDNFKLNIDSDKKNMSWWANMFTIPYISSYLKLDLKSFCKKLEHELGHVFRWRKSKDTLPIIWNKRLDNIAIKESEKGFQNLDGSNLEEWINKFTEEAIDKNIDKMDTKIRYWHIATFIAENYSLKEWIKIMKIYLKLEWMTEERAENTAIERIKRCKRRFPLDEPGAYWKETIYYRNKKNVIDLVKETQNKSDIKKLEKLTKDAFIAKIDEKNIEWFGNIVKDRIKEEDYNKIPYAIGKIIFKKLTEGNINNIQEWDIRFSFNKMNLNTKKALYEILSFTKRNLK